MKNFDEFKGYRTRIEYDAETKTFVCRSVAPPLFDISDDNAGGADIAVESQSPRRKTSMGK